MVSISPMASATIAAIMCVAASLHAGECVFKDHCLCGIDTQQAAAELNYVPYIAPQLPSIATFGWKNTRVAILKHA